MAFVFLARIHHPPPAHVPGAACMVGAVFCITYIKEGKIFQFYCRCGHRGGGHGRRHGTGCGRALHWRVQPSPSLPSSLPFHKSHFIAKGHRRYESYWRFFYLHRLRERKSRSVRPVSGAGHWTSNIFRCRFLADSPSARASTCNRHHS